MYVSARYGWNALEQNPWKAENMYKVDTRETQLKIAFYFTFAAAELCSKTTHTYQVSQQGVRIVDA